ncbi:Protein MOR1 [Glycine soja]
MPASPSENQTRWRKRKRDSQISRRHQKHEEEEEEEEDDDDDENPNGATRSTIRRTKRTITTDGMEKAIKNKVAKAVVPAIDVMFQALRCFQNSLIIKIKTKGLTLELCRWIEKKLEAELVNVTGTAKPTRKIRWMSDFDGFEFSHPEYSIQGSSLLSEQDKEPEQEAVLEVVGPGPSEEFGNDAI